MERKREREIDVYGESGKKKTVCSWTGAMGYAFVCFEKLSDERRHFRYFFGEDENYRQLTSV